MTAPKTNGFPAEKVKDYVSRVENRMDDLASEQGSYMARCRAIREDIKNILDEAKDDGIPKKELRKVIRTRELEAKASALRDEMEPDEQDNYDLIRLALGDLADTDLGQSVLERQAARAKQSSADVDDLVD